MENQTETAIFGVRSMGYCRDPFPTGDQKVNHHLEPLTFRGSGFRVEAKPLNP